MVLMLLAWAAFSLRHLCCVLSGVQHVFTNHYVAAE